MVSKINESGENTNKNECVKGYIDDNILDKAINTWGKQSQIEMVIEECLELAVALQKLKRLRGDMVEKTNNVIDEIADVKIMIKQAEKLFDLDKINERVDFKMNRLSERIETHLM